MRKNDKKNRKINSVASEDLSTQGVYQATERKSNIIYFTITKHLITIFAWVTGLSYTWLQINTLITDNYIRNSLSDANAVILLKFSLALYFLSWVFGTKHDLDDEKYSFYTQKHNKWRYVLANIIILLLWFTFMKLCSGSNPKIIATLLIIFYLLDFCSWRFLLYYMRDMFTKNSLNKNRDHEYYMGKFVKEFLSGSGQIARFTTGFVILITANVIIYLNLSEAIATALKLPSKTFIEVILISSFIFVNESWMWYRRLIRKLKFRFISLIPLIGLKQIEIEEDTY